MGHQDTNQPNADDEEVEREQLLNDDLQQDEQEISKDGQYKAHILSTDSELIVKRYFYVTSPPKHLMQFTE